MKSSSVKLSIITVVYNDNRNLVLTIDSLKKQSLKDFELIVIDGGSADGTVEFIKSQSDFVTAWISEPDKGIYDAMNKGIGYATGDVICFLNTGDSFADVNILQKISNYFFEKWSETDVIYCDTNIVSSNNIFIKRLSALDFTRKNLKFYGTRTVCHQSVFIKREICPRYDIQYRLKAELNWYFDILSKTSKIHHLKEFGINYKLGGYGQRNFTANIYERCIVLYSRFGIFQTLLVLPLIATAIVFNSLSKIRNKIANKNFMQKDIYIN